MNLGDFFKEERRHLSQKPVQPDGLEQLIIAMREHSIFIHNYVEAIESAHRKRDMGFIANRAEGLATRVNDLRELAEALQRITTKHG